MKVGLGWSPLTSGPVGPVTQRASGTELALGTAGAPLPCWPSSSVGWHHGQLCWAPRSWWGPQSHSRVSSGALVASGDRPGTAAVCAWGEHGPVNEWPRQDSWSESPSLLLSGYKVWIPGKSEGERKLLPLCLLIWPQALKWHCLVCPQAPHSAEGTCCVQPGQPQAPCTGLSPKLAPVRVTWRPAGLEVG